MKDISTSTLIVVAVAVAAAALAGLAALRMGEAVGGGVSASVVPNAFDVKYAFNAGSYGFTPPLSGKYYVVMGFANYAYGCYADWKIYSYTITTS